MIDTEQFQHYVRLLTAELHELQRKQQTLIAALDRARAELTALDGGIAYFDGEALLHDR